MGIQNKPFSAIAVIFIALVFPSLFESIPIINPTPVIAAKSSMRLIVSNTPGSNIELGLR
jgi:hypothetical protein